MSHEPADDAADADRSRLGAVASRLIGCDANELPPVRTITRGAAASLVRVLRQAAVLARQRYVLGMEVPFEHRSPTPDDTIRIGMVDLQDNDRWIELARRGPGTGSRDACCSGCPGISRDHLETTAFVTEPASGSSRT